MQSRKLSSLNRDLFSLIKSSALDKQTKLERAKRLIKKIVVTQGKPPRFFWKCFCYCLPFLKTEPLDINAQDDDGNSAMIVAAAYGYSDIIKELAISGAEINALNSRNNSALIWAAHHRQLAAVDTLLDLKADMEVRNTEGNTALICATHQGDISIVSSLILAKADLNKTDRKGDAALMWAAYKGHLGVLEKLLHAKANLHIVNFAGRAAFDEAVKNAKLHAMNLLLSHGAIIRDPFKLASFLRKIADQRHPALLPILTELIKQQDLLRVNKSPPLLNEEDYETVKMHFKLLRELDENHRKPVIKAILAATDVAEVVARLIAEYDVPLARIGLFDREEISQKLAEVQSEVMSGFVSSKQKR